MASSTFDTLLKDCSEFRVLVSGRSGAGKTTLVKEIFRIETLQASDKDPGECDIEDEIRSPDNKLFVLHDSKGFEPGEDENFNRVKAFIERRAQEPLIKNRLHAVWLCLEIPTANGRLLEAGDEEFLKLPFVPVTIVFTKYDKLYDQLFYNNVRALAPMEPNQREELIQTETENYFQENCIKHIKEIKKRLKNLEAVWVSTFKDASGKQRYPRTLIELVEVTLKQLSNVQGSDRSTWIVSAAAQRVNANTKVASCIEVGIQKHWRDLAASIYLANQHLRDCIDVIHNDIVRVWNFRDEGKILQKNGFKEAVCILVDDLADPHGRDPSSDRIKNRQNINANLAAVAPIAPPIDFIMKWFSERSTRDPDILRCLMGYIVDVTNVLEILFWSKVARAQSPVIDQEDIDKALKLYQGSTPHVEVHRQVRIYVDKMKPQDHINQDDKTHLMVANLINSNRHALPIGDFFPQENIAGPRTVEPTPARPPAAGPSTLINSPANKVQPTAIQPEFPTLAAPGKKKKFFSFLKFFRRKQ